MNYFARTLAARKDMADLLVGVTGDFVPAREVLRPGYLLNLFRRPAVRPPAPGRMTIDPTPFAACSVASPPASRSSRRATRPAGTSA